MRNLLSFVVAFGVLTSVLVQGNEDPKQGFIHIGSLKTRSSARSFDSNEYYVSINPATWNNAEADCQATFGPSTHLVSLETKEESDGLNVLLEDYGSGFLYWTSGLYNGGLTQWQWITNNNELGSWSPWDTGMPARSPSALHRIALAHTSRFSSNWRTLFNTQMLRYICEVA